MKRRILITGSSGMLGIDLSHELQENYEVAGLDVVGSPPRPVAHKSRGRQSAVRRFYKGDITDSGSVTDIIAKARPDVVIHVAAWTDVDGCEFDKKRAYKVNADGAKSVALACKASGATMIYISTDFVFDGKKKRPYKETDKTGPLSAYGNSKLKGEDAVAGTLEKYFILRTSWLYGKNGKNFVDTIIAKASTDKMLKVVDDQVGSPTYTKDLARAVHKLLDIVVSRKSYVLRCGTYHVSNSGSVSWYDYAKTTLRLTGSKTRVVPISSKELNRPAIRPAMSVLDNSKFIRFTGYRMRAWKSALREYLRNKK